MRTHRGGGGPQAQAAAPDGTAAPLPTAGLPGAHDDVGPGLAQERGPFIQTNREQTMFKTTTIAALAAAAALGLSACDVKKTQEGSVNLPKYDVKKTEEGNVTPPKYDVTAPDVKVGTKETTVN